MKTLTMCLVALATVAWHQPDRHTWRRTMDANGLVRLEIEYRDGVRDGVYRSWYTDGRLAEVRHYVEGREEGVQQAWAPDGQLYLNYEMRNGRRYGLVNAAPCLPVGEEGR